jgi:thioredoxin
MPVGVDFWAPWCGPCRMMAPEMEKVAARLHGRVKVVKANVDEKGALTVRYQAISIPTLLVVHQGREIAHHVGFLPA